jgi:Ca2+-transporting ATPase
MAVQQSSFGEQAWHALDAGALAAALSVDPRCGLPAQEAAARLRAHGPNALAQPHHTPPWRLFLNQFRNVLVAILIAATVLSAFVGEYVDAGIILAIVLFCAGLGFVQEYRAGRALDALRSMLAPRCTVLRDGRELKVAVADLVPGDILLLEAGDRIPADARLLESHSVHCDEAALTGESMPVAKLHLPLHADAPVADRRNMVFAGTSVTLGRGRAAVCATGMHTEFGRIAGVVAGVESEKTPLERRTDEIGRILGLATLAICVLVVGVSVARDLAAGTFSVAGILPIVMFAIALAVAAVPEALAAIVTGALAIAMHDMAKRNALVRRMPAVETLGCVSVICTDKTGTLTRGEMTVRRLHAGGRMIAVGGGGYAPDGRIEADIGDAGIRLLLTAGLLASDATLQEDAQGRWHVKGDPTEGALVVLAAKGGVPAEATRLACERIGEFPFSSERMRMTSVHTMPDGGRMAFMKGAPEVVLARCASIQDGSASRPLDAAMRASLHATGEAMAADALRVLAVACRRLPASGPAGDGEIEQDMVFLGYIGMMDPPRAEAQAAVAVCRRIGIRPVMITGDHKLTAIAVAREIGIYRDGDRVVDGEALAAMDDAALSEVVEQVSVYSRVAPLDKLKIVRAWQRRGHVVAMTGDGVNDAPALKHADIGVAMGIAGTDVARESADIVLADDNFATIITAVERGRWIYDNIRKYLTYLLRTNITEVIVLGGVVMFLGTAFLPLLPAAILYVNLASDGLPALALGIAPPDRDIMQRPPRDPAESVFSFEVRVFILLAVLIECPLFLWVFLHQVDDIERARTSVFLLFVAVELLLAMSFRSLRYSLFEAPPHRWLVIAIVWEVALIAFLLQFEAVRAAFGIRMPVWPEVAWTALMAVGVLASMETAKWVMRHQRGGQPA